jgi:inosine-uridine nucleoside N-ribohydrolase
LVKIVSRWQGELRERTDVVQLSTLVGDYAAEVARRQALYVAEQKRRADWEVEKAAADAIRRPALAAMMTEIKAIKYVSDYTELGKLPLEVIEAITKALAAQNAQTAQVA